MDRQVRTQSENTEHSSIFIIMAALLLGIAFFCSQAQAATGITQEIIDISESANTEAADFSETTPYLTEYILPTAECTTHFTGETTHVMIAPGRVGEMETFADGMCIGDGCIYTMGGNYGAGAGECVR